MSIPTAEEMTLRWARRCVLYWEQRCGIGALGRVFTSNGPGVLPTWAAPGETAPGSTSVAQGTVDFGEGNDYAEVVVSAGWVSAAHRMIPSVRGGTSDHPIADEDAALEELRAVVVGITVGASITVGVHAPNTTTGQYLVDVLGAA